MTYMEHYIMIKLDDSIIVHFANKYRTRYRAFCDYCGRDRGYLAKQAAMKPKCKKCGLLSLKREDVRLKMSLAKRNKSPHNKGQVGVSPETSLKMSKAARNRTPDTRNTGPKTLSTRIKISCKIRGIQESDFIDFSTSKEHRERDKLVARNLTKSCFQRDDYTCQKCQHKGGKLAAHHANSWKFFPEERFSINNLVTLCNKCHRDFHKQFGNGIKTANTREQLEYWISSALSLKS